MNVKIIETGKIVELTYRPRTAEGDWAEEVIGNNDGFGSPEDGKIKRTITEYGNTEYEATAQTVEWWKDFFAGEEATDAEIAELADKLDVSEVDVRDYVAQRTGDFDLEHYRAKAIEALQELRDDPSLIQEEQENF